MIKAFHGWEPDIAPDARVAQSAVVVGQVTVEAQASLWYGAVLRGDEDSIRVGAGSNIQDNAVLHCDPGVPLKIGRDVTVGHSAVVHGCTVGDQCLIGMGAILLSGCVIGEQCVIAAGALVTQNKVIPPGSMVMGTPAKVVRPLTQAERDELAASAAEYRRVAAEELPTVSGRSAEPEQDPARG